MLRGAAPTLAQRPSSRHPYSNWMLLYPDHRATDTGASTCCTQILVLQTVVLAWTPRASKVRLGHTRGVSCGLGKLRGLCGN